jgi:hypothetical protein
MADRYWVGGAGTWDATSTTNWATSSGGAGGASAPTSSDNVIFDSLSNAIAYTVTVGTDAVCNDLTADGALVGNVTFSLSATAKIDCHSNFTLAATGITWTGVTGTIVTFRATTTGKTITTNGVTLTNTRLDFNGVGGEWALGSALTYGAGSAFNVIAGTFNTGNFNITGGAFNSTGNLTRAINLGSSTVTLSSTTVVTFSGLNLTFNAGTSQITCGAVNPTFNGGGLTFYNVSVASAANGGAVINGANTFNDLTFTSRNATGRRAVTFNDNQTVNGTLTFGSANTAIRRMFVLGTIGTQRTITLNGTLAALSDVDFLGINAAGTVATPWTGTRLGDCKDNANITFDAPKTVYWNLSGSQVWSATAWATTNNGSPNVDNFPLAQDTATFTEAGDAGTVTINDSWNIGSIQMADGVSNRSTAFTLATSTPVPNIYGNITLFSSLTLTGTGNLTFLGQGTTQTITSAGVTFTQPITINSPSGTVQLLDNVTTSGTVTLTSGTLDLSSGNRTLTCNIFSSSNANTRSIAFGTGNITLTGNAGNIWAFNILTNFSYTGTSTVNATYSGSTGTRQLNHGGTTGGTESNAVNVNVTNGTDNVNFTNATSTAYKNINFTGFSGTFNNVVLPIYGNLIFSSAMTIASGANSTRFFATSGTQQVTTNGQTLDFPINQDGVGGTVQLQDNLTMGSTRTFTLTNGALDLNDKVLTAGAVSTSNSNTRSIDFGTNGLINCEGAFTATTATGLTTAGRGRIKMSSASAKTFAGGGANYAGVALEQAGAGTLTITGANTFDDITNSNATASQITFQANTTTSVRKLSVSGSSGNLVSLRSSTDGTKFTIQTV